MQRQLLRLSWAGIVGLFCLPTLWGQGAPQNSAIWNGGSGAWSDQNQWMCGIAGQGSGPCVPNGGQFEIVLLNGGTINVDIGVTVASIVDAPGTTALTLDGTSLTSPAIQNLGSVQLTNMATINTSGLSTADLHVDDSTINGLTVVGTPGGGPGAADVVGGTIQRLGVGGFFSITDSKLGDNSQLISIGSSSLISGTSFNGQLDLSAPGAVTMDGGSTITSVLFGSPLPVNIGSQPNSSALLLIQGGSQLLVKGNDVILGGDATASGELTLDDTSSVTAKDETVGDLGTGVFNQNGGTNSINGTLSLGDKAGASGDYELKGTGILTANDEVIGFRGTGDFTQNSGTQSLNGIIGDLTLGSAAGGSGQYTLGGAGNDVTAGNEVIGDSGEGTFFQSAGSDNKIGGALTLGKSNGGTGTYDMTGGTLEANTEVVGGQGLSGTFKQSGGTNTVAGDLGIASNGSALGTYNLSGKGTLIAGSETLGNDPCLILSCPVAGTFNQTGGGNATANLTINFGNYNLSGGSLQAGTITDNGTIAVSGTGSLSATALTIGKAGSMTLTGPSINVNISGSTTARGAIIETGVAGGTISWGDFSGDSPIVVDPATNIYKNLTILSTGYVQATAGSVFDVTGNFVDDSTQKTLWVTNVAELEFGGGGTHTFDLAGVNGAGFANNFAWGTLVIDAGNILDLGTGSGDALYVNFLQGLDISGNLITNIDGAAGLFIYYNAADNPFLQGNYNFEGGGELIAANGPAPTPEPGTLLLMAGGLGSFVARRRWRRKKCSSSSH